LTIYQPTELNTPTEDFGMLHTRVFSVVVGCHLHFTFWWTIFLTLVNVMPFKWMRNVIHT